MQDSKKPLKVLIASFIIIELLTLYVFRKYLSDYNVIIICIMNNNYYMLVRKLSSIYDM